MLTTYFARHRREFLTILLAADKNFGQKSLFSCFFRTNYLNFHGFMVELHFHGWVRTLAKHYFKYMLSDITVNIIFEYQNAVDRNWNPFGHCTALPTYTIKLIMDFFSKASFNKSKLLFGCSYNEMVNFHGG